MYAPSADIAGGPQTSWTPAGHAGALGLRRISWPVGVVRIRFDFGVGDGDAEWVEDATVEGGGGLGAVRGIQTQTQEQVQKRNTGVLRFSSERRGNVWGTTG